MNAYETAHALVTAGFAAIPARAEIKHPAVKWKPYQSRLPRHAEMRSFGLTPVDLRSFLFLRKAPPMRQELPMRKESQMDDFATRLHDAIVRYNHFQREAAVAIGVQYETLRPWLRGQIPSAANLVKAERYIAEAPEVGS